jgi:hypothetical protein
MKRKVKRKKYKSKEVMKYKSNEKKERKKRKVIKI